MFSVVSGVSFAEVQVAAVELAAGVRSGAGVRAEDPGVKPNPNGLPGIALLKDLVGGVLVVALILCLLGLVVSAASWAVGSQSGNSHAASKGKTGVMVACGAAILVGGANFLIGSFSAMGSRL